MRKERRDTPRIAIRLPAMLRLDRHFHLFETRDLSLDGVFIETGPVRLPRRDTLELALKLPAVDGTNGVHRVTARLARRTPRGAALVFEAIGTETYSALLDLVFSRQAAGVR